MCLTQRPASVFLQRQNRVDYRKVVWLLVCCRCPRAADRKYIVFLQVDRRTKGASPEAGDGRSAVSWRARVAARRLTTRIIGTADSSAVPVRGQTSAQARCDGGSIRTAPQSHRHNDYVVTGLCAPPSQQSSVLTDRVCFWILCVGVFEKSSTMAMNRGTWNRAMRFSHHATNSA